MKKHGPREQTDGTLLSVLTVASVKAFLVASVRWNRPERRRAAIRLRRSLEVSSVHAVRWLAGGRGENEIFFGVVAEYVASMKKKLAF
jgi:hypothetical protein